MNRVMLLLSLICAASAWAQPTPADILLTAGKVFTNDARKAWADALAIRGDRIVAVGTSADVRRFAGPSTRVIDLRGRTVVPGFNDAHLHLPGRAQDAIDVHVAEGASRRTLLDAVRHTVETNHGVEPVAAMFPLDLLDADVSRDDLDGISRVRPIRLWVLGNHAALLNTPALRAWGIAEDTADPAGGRYGRRRGRLDGWIYEHALWRPQEREAQASSDVEIRAELREFEAEALSLGLTSVQTMPFIPAARLRALLASMHPKLRWRVIDLRLAPYDGTPSTLPVKYIADGTPIERNAAMRQPYADAPSHRGMLNFSEADVAAMVRDAAFGKGQLLVHATGDRALETVITAMERTTTDWPRLRLRLEHGDALMPDLDARARKLGAIVVQNPSHFMLREVVTARFGAERLKTLMPVRSLIEAGNHVALGSDGALSPFLNLFFAAIHPTNPGEALTVEQGVRAYTSGSAFAEFEEAQRGDRTGDARGPRGSLPRHLYSSRARAAEDDERSDNSGREDPLRTLRTA